MSNGRRDVVIGLAIGAVMGVMALRVVPALAGADNNSATDNLPRIIAYSGTIELGGAAYDGGTLDLQFTLFDKTNFALWTEEQDGVAVDSKGRFSVLLGSVTALTDAALTSGAVELAVSLRKPNGTFTALGGRQKIGAVPKGNWFKAADDLTVVNNATLNGTATFGSTLQLRNTTCDIGSGQGRAYLGTSASGPHGFSFANPSGTGMQMVYRTSPNALIFEPVNDFTDGANVWTSTLGTGDMDTAAAASFASTLTCTDDLSISPPSSATVGLDMVGGDLLMAKNTSGDKYLAFSEATSGEGMQMHYAASGNAFEIESGTSLTNSTDLFTVDADDSHTYAKGNFYASKIVLDMGDDFSATKTLEDNSADKTFYSDTSCPNGAIAGGVNGSNQGMLCVCLTSAEKTHGWYCFE